MKTMQESWIELREAVNECCFLIAKALRVDKAAYMLAKIIEFFVKTEKDDGR